MQLYITVTLNSLHDSTSSGCPSTITHFDLCPAQFRTLMYKKLILQEEMQKFLWNLSISLWTYHKEVKCNKKGTGWWFLVASNIGLLNAYSNLSPKSWSRYKNLLQAVSLSKFWKQNFFVVSLCVIWDHIVPLLLQDWNVLGTRKTQKELVQWVNVHPISISRQIIKFFL